MVRPSRPQLTAVAAALAACTALLSPSAAEACSCVASTLEQGFESADAVFEGQVTGLEVIKGSGLKPDARRATFKVVRVWKGDQQAEKVAVETAMDSARCGFNFEKGVSYLVFAHDYEGQLQVTLCSRTQRTQDAKEDLAALGAGITPVAVDEAAAAETEEEPGNEKAAGDDPQAEGASQELPPSARKGSGGCASCSATGGPAPGLLWSAGAAWLALSRRRKRA